MQVSQMFPDKWFILLHRWIQRYFLQLNFCLLYNIHYHFLVIWSIAKSSKILLRYSYFEKENCITCISKQIQRKKVLEEWVPHDIQNISEQKQRFQTLRYHYIENNHIQRTIHSTVPAVSLGCPVWVEHTELWFLHLQKYLF